ncbi:hypothetical protein FACS189460_0960 [Deltaproteobacteria bacterium]|nr:hypothetical protein FACS189460_0960 [Deltaproteobacteria bacterium]
MALVGKNSHKSRGQAPLFIRIFPKELRGYFWLQGIQQIKTGMVKIDFIMARGAEIAGLVIGIQD